MTYTPSRMFAVGEDVGTDMEAFLTAAVFL